MDALGGSSTLPAPSAHRFSFHRIDPCDASALRAFTPVFRALNEVRVEPAPHTLLSTYCTHHRHANRSSRFPDTLSPEEHLRSRTFRQEVRRFRQARGSWLTNDPAGRA